MCFCGYSKDNYDKVEGVLYPIPKIDISQWIPFILVTCRNSLNYYLGTREIYLIIWRDDQVLLILVIKDRKLARILRRFRNE